MNCFFIIRNMLENKKDWVDYISIISTFGSVYVAWLALKMSEKQNKIEKCSIIYDSIIREKQEKIIELRKIYLNFKNSCMYILSIIFPTALAQKNQKLGEILQLNIKNSTEFFPLFSKNGAVENSDTFLINGKNYSLELFKLLEQNEVFLKDNQILYDDLYKTSKAFYNYFLTIGNDTNKKQIFTILSKKMDETGDFLKECNITKILRVHFYEFMYCRLIFSREKQDGTKSKEHIIYMTENSIFNRINKEDRSYSRKNIEKWSENNIIAMETYGIFYSWFDFWLKQIDVYFKKSFDNIEKVMNDNIINNFNK